jgi:hypothetical protein
MLTDAQSNALSRQTNHNRDIVASKIRSNAGTSRRYSFPPLCIRKVLSSRHTSRRQRTVCFHGDTQFATGGNSERFGIRLLLSKPRREVLMTRSHGFQRVMVVLLRNPDLSADRTAGECFTMMACPLGLMRAGQSGHSARMLSSHCSIIARKRRGRE